MDILSLLSGKSVITQEEFSKSIRGVSWPCNDENTLWLVSVTKSFAVGECSTKFILTPSIVGNDKKVIEWHIVKISPVKLVFSSPLFKRLFPQCEIIQKFISSKFNNDTLIQIETSAHRLSIFNLPVQYVTYSDCSKKNIDKHKYTIRFTKQSTKLTKILMVLYYHTKWIVFTENNYCFIITDEQTWVKKLIDD